jgi:hypothetical protein
MNLEFPWKIFKNFMKLGPLRAELLRGDKRMDRQTDDETNSRFSQFSERASNGRGLMMACIKPITNSLNELHCGAVYDCIMYNKYLIVSTTVWIAWRL